jgi:DNA-binding LytR/AlgR family response regulator
MLKAIAIDDEPVALEVIKSLVNKIDFVDLVANFTNPFEALSYLHSNTVDLIFLDINMPDISGLEFLRSISISRPMVIFTTAHSEYALQGYELDVMDYLMKPFSLPRFLKACSKAQEYHNARGRSHETAAGVKTSIFIKTGYRQVRIEMADILYVESIGNYMQFVLKEGKIASRLTMNETETLLPATDFVRIHRSYLVAKNRVTRVDRRSVWIGDTELPLSVNYSDEIQKMMK